MANITTDNINTIAQIAASINDGDYILFYKAGAQTFSKIEKSVFFQAFGANGISANDIINNCTDGGADKALSAEMGKVLKDNLTIVQANVQLLLDALANLAFTNVPKPTLTPIEWNAIPSVSVSPSSLSFSAIVGGTGTATFTVNGSNLNGSLSIGISGSNGSLFSVDKSTITANEAASGATIAVTYHPSARGTHSATITISGGGASAKTISLNGTAINQDVATYNVTHNLTNLNMVPDGGTVESGGTFSGTLSVTDSSLYELPASIQVSGTHGTISYNRSTGAFSIQNILSAVEITAAADDKPIENVLSIVRGWVFTEDQTIKADVYNNTGGTYQWTFPRKPFIDNIHNAAHCLSNHGVAINSNNGLLYSDSSHGLPQDTSGETSSIYLCYTDYIRIPTNASATGIYYRPGFTRLWINNTKQCAPYIKFYKKENGVMVPILAKSTPSNGTYRTLGSSDLGDVLTMIQSSSYEIYCRASFVTSDENTVNADCCLKFNSALGSVIWSADDPIAYPYQIVDNPLGDDGDTGALYSSSDGTMTNETVYNILKAGKTVAS